MFWRSIIVAVAVYVPVIAALAGRVEPANVNNYFKKGVGGGGYCGDLDDGVDGLLTVTWWYDWGHTARGFAQCNGTSPLHAEYVPMVWGKWALNNATALIDSLKFAAPKARYIFGFNEPDHSGSYLKPEDAATRWSAMEYVADRLNLTLIGPCVSSYNSGSWWLRQFTHFFSNITGRQPRMDHMCLHQYTTSVAGMKATLAAVFRDYRRPVWVNEFACPPYKNCTAAHQLAFMKEALPMLEASPYVFQYAWYVNRDNRPPHKGDDSLHVINKTSLTPLGEYYRSFTPSKPPPQPVPPAPRPVPGPPPPRPPSPGPQPKPSCSIAGKEPLNSTTYKYCYQLCDYHCFEKECEKYYVTLHGVPVPCVYVRAMNGSNKGKCNEAKNCTVYY